MEQKELENDQYKKREDAENFDEEYQQSFVDEN